MEKGSQANLGIADGKEMRLKYEAIKHLLVKSDNNQKF